MYLMEAYTSTDDRNYGKERLHVNSGLVYIFTLDLLLRIASQIHNMH